MSKHHTIPEFYIKNFYNCSDQVFYCQKSDQKKVKITPRNSGSIFYIRHHNSFKNDDGSYNESLETKFAYDDGVAAVLYKEIKKHLDAEKIPVFDRETRRIFDTYNINLFMRSQFIVDNFPIDLGSINLKYIEGFTRKNGLKPSCNQLERISHLAERNALNAFQEIRKSTPKKTFNYINSNKLLFITINNDIDFFIIGDRHSLRITGDKNLHEMKDCLFAPISSKYGIAYVAQTDSRNIIELKNSSEIYEINKRIAQQSSSFAGASEALIKSIANDLSLAID